MQNIIVSLKNLFMNITKRKKKINKKSSISIVKYTLTSKTKSSMWFLFILQMFQVKGHVTKSIETNIKIYITKDIKIVWLGFSYLVIFLKLIYLWNMYSIQMKSKKNKERTHKGNMQKQLFKSVNNMYNTTVNNRK